MKMKFRSSLIVIAAILAALTISCKKDDDPTYKVFTGSLNFTIPVYAKVGDTMIFKPGLLYKEDGVSLTGICWQVKEIEAAADTTRLETDPQSISGSKTFIVPDTLGTFQVCCTGFADGYYPTTANQSFTSLKEGLNTGSITDFDLYDDDIEYTDPRDGKTYLCAEIGPLVWMRLNLSYSGSGHPYGGSETLEKIFGRFYTWNEAVNACPEGWRLPDEKDWVSLAKEAGNPDCLEFNNFSGVAGATMVNARFNSEKMWEFWPKVTITNSTRFSAMPFGYANIDDNGKYDFQAIFQYGAFWSADSWGVNGVYHYINPEINDIFAGNFPKDRVAMPVRCVRDK